jgi:quinolinate synthase
MTAPSSRAIPSGIPIEPGLPLCQSDYPLDRYQREFAPYAQEYLSLPDRTPETVLPWMESYLEPALRELGDSLLLLAHYYMGGEIVQLVERFGGRVADSYQLAIAARAAPQKKLIVESAVHFMAEAIAILAHPDQRVFITNPKAGCTLEMHAKESMVEPAFTALVERYGEEGILPVAYMNTSGRVKAMTGARGGAVCTSSNAARIFRWAVEQGRKVFFIPDRHLGENIAAEVGIGSDETAHWPGGVESLSFDLAGAPAAVRDRFDRARLVLFGSACGVHTFFRPPMVEHWRREGYAVLVHPECPRDVCRIADGSGSTSFLWRAVLDDERGTGRYAIGTEGHFVRNLRRAAAARGIAVVHLGEAPTAGGAPGLGCGCATMSRNDPPHLVALVDLLRRGTPPDINEVEAGDVVDEFTGMRERLSEGVRAELRRDAGRALERMIELTG